MLEINDANIGLIYGTDTGNTEEVGERIADALAELGCPVEMINVVDASSKSLESFDMLILGIPTWDFGGIQEDWENFESELLNSRLSGKVVALYGLGDQRGYGDYFLDAMGWLHDHVIKTGASVIGHWSTEGYDFEESLAVNEDKSLFCGLGIDEDQQFELTEARVTGWVAQLVSEFKQLQLKAG